MEGLLAFDIAERLGFNFPIVKRKIAVLGRHRLCTLHPGFATHARSRAKCARCGLVIFVGIAGVTLTCSLEKHDALLSAYFAAGSDWRSDDLLVVHDEGGGARTLRVMSFNIWVGGEAGNQPLDQTAKVIEAAHADIVGVQESCGKERDGKRPDNAGSSLKNSRGIIFRRATTIRAS